MSPAVSVSPFELEQWHIYRDLRLGALADSPDAFSTMLHEQEDRPDDYWTERIVSAGESDLDLALLATVDLVPAGLSFAKIPTSQRDQAHVFQMWVAPNFRRNGVARKLLNEIATWASKRNALCLVLDVSCGDTPAAHLYSAMGFRTIGQPQPLRPGSKLLSQTMQLDLARPEFK